MKISKKFRFSALFWVYYAFFLPKKAVFLYTKFFIFANNWWKFKWCKSLIFRQKKSVVNSEQCRKAAFSSFWVNGSKNFQLMEYSQLFHIKTFKRLRFSALFWVYYAFFLPKKAIFLYTKFFIFVNNLWKLKWCKHLIFDRKKA